MEPSGHARRLFRFPAALAASAFFELSLSTGSTASARSLTSCWSPRKSSRIGKESRRYLLDFGFTPDVYANNLELLKIDVRQIDALIISHGHFDHVGGLMGFLETYRPRMRKGLRLYTGGEDNFCSRFNRNADGSFTSFGTALDRRKLRALEVDPVLSEAPLVIEGHAFTTGAVPRASMEHVRRTRGSNTE